MLLNTQKRGIPFNVGLMIFIIVISGISCFISFPVIRNDTVSEEMNTISRSVVNSKPKWYNENWHKSMYMTVGGANHYRYGGIPVEYLAPFDVSTLDPNSIRVLKKTGKIDPATGSPEYAEILSEYDPVSKKVVFVVDEPIDASGEKNYAIYYDAVENGIKEVPNYDVEWVSDYTLDVDQYDSEKPEREYAEWTEERNIYEENGIYYFNGSIVYHDENTGFWYYENGTQVVNYAIVTHYYNGQVVEIINGSWYYSFNDTSVLEDIDVANDIVSNVSLFDENGAFEGTIFRDGPAGILYYYNATGSLEGTYIEGVGQSVFMNSTLDGMMLDSLMTDESGRINDWQAGSVKATGSVFGDYYNPVSGTWVRQNVKALAYRGASNVKFSVTNNETDTGIVAWEDALFNLNGTIFFNNTEISRHNATDYYENNTGESTENYKINLGNKRIKVVTESNDINMDVDNMDWTIDNSSTYDLTNEYDGKTGRSYKVSDRLLVKPYLLSSRYFSIYDVETGKGVGISFPNAMAFSKILIEIWREELDSGAVVNYYLKLGMNYLDWGYQSLSPYLGSITPEMIYQGIDYAKHLVQSGQFDFILSYLDSVDVKQYMDSLLEELIGIRPKPLLKFLNKILPIPLQVLIHRPRPMEVFKRAEDIEINVTVIGETLKNIYYKFGQGVKVTFSGTVKFWENQVTTGHFATNGVIGDENVMVPSDIKGDVLISIFAEDTNGTFIMSSVPIILETPEQQAGFILGFIGIGVGVGVAVMFVSMKSKLFKKGRSAPSIGSTRPKDGRSSGIDYRRSSIGGSRMTASPKRGKYSKPSMSSGKRNL